MWADFFTVCGNFFKTLFGKTQRISKQQQAKRVKGEVHLRQTDTHVHGSCGGRMLSAALMPCGSTLHQSKEHSGAAADCSRSVPPEWPNPSIFSSPTSPIVLLSRSRFLSASNDAAEGNNGCVAHVDKGFRKHIRKDKYAETTTMPEDNNHETIKAEKQRRLMRLSAE